MTKQLAHQTVQKLTQQLVESPNSASLANDEIIQVITEVIDSTYKSCKKSLRQDFYKELSRLLHSDRLAGSTQYENLATYLKTRGLIDEPQRILIEHHARQSATPILSFFKEVFTQPSQSLDLLKRHSSDNPLITNLERYSDPFKLGALILIVIVGVSSILLSIVSELISGIARSLINSMNGFINIGLNKITDDGYEEMSLHYKTANFAEYKKQFLLEARIEAQAKALLDDSEFYASINVMDDADFWDYLLTTITPSEGEPTTSSAEQLAEARIKKLTSFTLDRIRSAFFAFYAAGTDENKAPLQRAMSLIVSPFTLAVVLLGEAISLAERGIFAVVNTANLLSYYAALSVLNAPLFSYDVSVFLFEYILDKDIVEHEVNATKIQKNPLYLLAYKPENTAHLSSELEPLQMGSPIQAPVVGNDSEVNNPTNFTLNI
ncbi:hypothetical protein ACD661_02755 [Legionella lytica]|uniref:Substrate of the Dot/Icm secretion system n=1 Tax=Legionella lytica TaxID=96232 RepID=A0ABW8D443_9GAMM